MKAGVLAFSMGHRHDDIIPNDVPGQFLELADPFIVRPIAAADRNGFLINPQNIAALHFSRRFNNAKRGNADAFQTGLCRLPLLPAKLFPHRKIDRSFPGNFQGIMRINRIQSRPVVLRKIVHIRNIICNVFFKYSVLLQNSFIIRTSEIFIFLPRVIQIFLTDERLLRLLQQN